MLVIEFFDNGLNRLFIVCVYFGYIGVEKFVEPFATCDKTYTHFAAFFPVLLILGLFVLGFGSFRSVVNSVYIVAEFFCNFFGFCVRALCSNNLHKFEVGIINGRQKTENFMTLIRKRAEVYGVVCNYFMLDFALSRVRNEYEYFVHAAILNFDSFGLGYRFACMSENFARFGVENILGKLASAKSVRQIKFFIELVSADFYHVVTARVEEQIVEMLTHRSFRRHFAGAEPSVKLYKTVALGFGSILRDGVFNHFIVCEQV